MVDKNIKKFIKKLIVWMDNFNILMKLYINRMNISKI